MDSNLFEVVNFPIVLIYFINLTKSYFLMQTTKDRDVIEGKSHELEEQKLRQEVKAAGLVSVVPQILDVASRITGMGFTAIARVTDTRWIACGVNDKINFGMKAGDELIIAETFCTRVRTHNAPIIIEDVPNDAIYCDHAIPAQYGFKSYISVPIRLPDGEFFGTLCALDPEPAKIDRSEIIGMFDLFSKLIGLHIHAAIQLENAEDSLLREKQGAELREQFIAVLGHDLKNPLGAIQGSADILSKLDQSPKSTTFIEIIKDSCKRMNSLIEDILDFARGRLGEGIVINGKCEKDLEAAVNKAITEIKVANPAHEIRVKHEIDEPVYCDQPRLLQVVSNLLANAVAYGENKTPIRVETQTNKEFFILKVKNQGKKISDELMPILFNPYCRGDKSRDGLGLGLYISSEIAKAHKGVLTVTSDDQETCFCFTISLRRPV